jgi:prepilin-type N-terminal cleavage/methylation domain-containing protein
MSEAEQNAGAEKQRAGFTWIELLVVISIISMLMSILLPGLSRAREAGKRVDCFSNLRQLMIALYFYSMENEDKFCSASTLWNESTWSNNWVADGPAWPSNDIGNTEEAVEDVRFVQVQEWPERFFAELFDGVHCGLEYGHYFAAFFEDGFRGCEQQLGVDTQLLFSY